MERHSYITVHFRRGNMGETRDSTILLFSLHKVSENRTKFSLEYRVLR